MDSKDSLQDTDSLEMLDKELDFMDSLEAMEEEEGTATERPALRGAAAHRADVTARASKASSTGPAMALAPRSSCRTSPACGRTSTRCKP